MESPSFLVSPTGIAYPTPPFITGPSPVINGNGIQTGQAFTEGAYNEVSTMRVMNPNQKFPNGYIKYENSLQQGVNPYTGKTVSHSQSHFGF